jgi:hypothetical protein
MKMLDKTVPPTNKAETFKYTVNTPVLIAVIPGSALFRAAKPYTAENIAQRGTDWLKESGFESQEKFIEFVKSFLPKLKQ